MHDIGIWLFVGAIVAVVVLWKLLATATAQPAAQFQVPVARPEPTQDDFFDLEGKGAFEIEAVGESYYQPALRAIVAGEKGYVERDVQAELYCEDDNAFDANAVRVMIDGKQVGHLGRTAAAVYRDTIRKAGFGKATGRCKAKIFGGSKDKPSYGVWLDI